MHSQSLRKGFGCAPELQCVLTVSKGSWQSNASLAWDGKKWTNELCHDGKVRHKHLKMIITSPFEYGSKSGAPNIDGDYTNLPLVLEHP